jgi:hypothetical protein
MSTPRDNTTAGPSAHAPAAATTTCADLANDAHARWLTRGTFPPFWAPLRTSSTPDNLRANLVRVFEFFCSMREPRRYGRQWLQVAIEARLRERHATAPPGWNPPPTRPDIIEQIRWFSDYQANRFRELGELVQPAFDAFAAGQLRGPAPGPDALALPGPLDRISYPNPDSAIFFCWSEFALAALSLGCDTDDWMRVLPILLRAQHIYVTAHHPSPRLGPPKFGHYTEDTWRAIAPADVAPVPFGPMQTPTQLADAATTSARSAFPGGMGS